MKSEQFHWTSERGWDRDPRGASLASTAQVVLLFGPASQIEAQRCVSFVREIFPQAHVFGCSTGGEIHGASVRDDTISLTALAFDHSRVGVAKTVVASVDQSFAAGAALVSQFDPVGLRHVIVLCDGMLVNSSELVRGVNAKLPPGVTVSGGFAADGNRLCRTHVWCDGEPMESTAIALGLYGERLRVGISVTGGWGPFGPDRLITKSKGNVLYEFDGRPALALYKQYLGEHAAALPAVGLMFPIELRTSLDGDRVLRALLAVDEKEQSITFAGNVPEGAWARFMVGHIEDLIDGAVTAAQLSCENLHAPAPQAVLLVSCNARRAVLKQRVEEEVEAVRQVVGPATTVAGFYSYGEIGPTRPGTAAELHNETMTIISFAEI